MDLRTRGGPKDLPSSLGINSLEVTMKFFDLQLFCKNNGLMDEQAFIQYILDKYIVDPAFTEMVEPWLPLLTLDDLEQLLEILEESNEVN